MARKALEGILFARVNVRMATEMCGGADLNGLERVRNLLESAALWMRQAELDLASGAPGSKELRRESASLKREVACLMRAVDGCTALYRGLSVRLSGAAPGYAPQGCATPAAGSAGACELVG
ncbi:MAG TPA: hypothetical protein VMU19_08825 [Bryobacteraceae bacterium]|nr:hypothetical protein [Bryobacteraceae bacterium]